MVAQPLNKSSPIILHPAKQPQREETPRENQIISLSRIFGGKRKKPPQMNVYNLNSDLWVSAIVLSKGRRIRRKFTAVF
jgi:hypothetical protein